MDKWNVEYTDTFAGEANYSWVKRETVELRPCEPDTVYTSASTVVRKRRAYNRELMHKAKAAMGLTGVKGRTHHYGDMIEFRPYGISAVMFVTWKEEPL